MGYLKITRPYEHFVECVLWNALSNYEMQMIKIMEERKIKSVATKQTKKSNGQIMKINT